MSKVRLLIFTIIPLVSIPYSFKVITAFRSTETIYSFIAILSTVLFYRDSFTIFISCYSGLNLSRVFGEGFRCSEGVN